MKVDRGGINQNWYGIRNVINRVLNQFSDKNIDVVGSKIEKIFIIFNFICI